MEPKSIQDILDRIDQLEQKNVERQADYELKNLEQHNALGKSIDEVRDTIDPMLAERLEKRLAFKLATNLGRGILYLSGAIITIWGAVRAVIELRRIF